jgi:hypothetical protein
MENGLQEPVRKQAKGDGRKMERPENGLRNQNMDSNSPQTAGSLFKFHSPLFLTTPTENPPLSPPMRSLPPLPHLPPHLLSASPCHTLPPHLLSTSTHAPRAPSGQSPYQDAVTSGNRRSVRFIQCAAAMQDTHQVPTISDRRMSSSRKEAADYKSYAEFIM